MGTITDYESIKNRILKRCVVDAQLGCLLWTGARDINGFGRINTTEGVRSVHRMMWIIANGEVELGMLVYHTCGNRNCCNLEHMYLSPLQQ